MRCENRVQVKFLNKKFKKVLDINSKNVHIDEYIFG